jgi:hypothetical protein
MALRYYVDVHVPIAIVTELGKRLVDVLRAQDDGAAELDDAPLLDRAKDLKRILVSSDKDFLSEVHKRQDKAIDFAGVVHYRPARVSLGRASHRGFGTHGKTFRKRRTAKSAYLFTYF